MMLDSEKQRELILQIIKNTPITGSYQQVKDSIAIVDTLIYEIINAKITSGE